MRYRIKPVTYHVVCFVLMLFSVSACKREKQNVIPTTPTDSTRQQDEWTNLLDTGLTHWEKFIGVPHYSVNLPNTPKGDGMNGTPLGLNNDPLIVFSTYTQDDGSVVLKVSGEIYGGLTTLKEYDNYHLQAEFRWGTKKYEPRLQAKRDNGILYHCYGTHGAFWNVWMNSHELQIQEGDFGDYFALGPVSRIPAYYDSVDNEHAWIYDNTVSLQPFGRDNPGRCRRGVDRENPTGKWNKLELICSGDSSIHIVNGVVVLRMYRSQVQQASGAWTSLTKGKIQLQSEGAEAYYRNVRIRAISSVPALYK